jgi:hypothetical protein
MAGAAAVSSGTSVRGAADRDMIPSRSRSVIVIWSVATAAIAVAFYA